MNGIAELYRLRLAETIAAGDTTPMMVFPIGEWHSALYPDLPLTEDLASEMIANFESGILGTEPVVDSSGKHDTSAPAAGWVKRVYLASYEEEDVTGLALWADVKWTALGATMLSDDQYKYGSVEIGPVVTNAAGDQVENVLRSLTLTNTPVLRIMPGVKNAAEKQRTVVTLSLSEVTLSTAPAAATVDTEDDGNPTESDPASSDGSSHPAKVDEGQPATLSEGDAATKGSDPMNPKTLKTLKLSEGADDVAIDAAVMALAEDRDTQKSLAETEKTRADTAEVKLSEAEKASSIAAFTIKLDEKIKTENTVSPGQRDYFLGLADRNMVEAELALASHTVKVIDVAERGSGSQGDDKPTKRADVELSELTQARMVKDGCDYVTAMNLTLSENPNDIKTRYEEFRAGKEG